MALSAKEYIQGGNKEKVEVIKVGTETAIRLKVLDTPDTQK
jgi:hypothetical protein